MATGRDQERADFLKRRTAARFYNTNRRFLASSLPLLEPVDLNIHVKVNQFQSYRINLGRHGILFYV